MKHPSADRSTKVTVPSSPFIRRQNHSRDIVGWDDPLKEERLWIVPAESEAAAAFVRIGGYRKPGDSNVLALPEVGPKQLRTLLSLRTILIDCY
jgi:hypothetical protein